MCCGLIRKPQDWRVVYGSCANSWINYRHGPWGISLSLGTGYCLAGMVLGEDRSEYVGRLGL